MVRKIQNKNFFLYDWIMVEVLNILPELQWKRCYFATKIKKQGIDPEFLWS